MFATIIQSLLSGLFGSAGRPSKPSISDPIFGYIDADILGL